MDNCFPSPEEPIIQPDERAKKLRAFLHIVYYGQMINVGIRFLMLGPWAGIFQLINLWVIYVSFATMHFCSVMIYMILCVFELLYIYVDWQRVMKDSVNPIFAAFFFYLFFYNLFAIFYCSRAYGHFKNLFMQQLGDIYARQNVNDDDDEAYQQEQRRMREQYYQRIQQVSSQARVQRQNQQQPEQQQQQRQDDSDSNQVNQNVYLQHQNSQPQPQGPPQVQVHDFRRRPGGDAAQQPQRQGTFTPFVGTGHKIE